MFPCLVDGNTEASSEKDLQNGSKSPNLSNLQNKVESLSQQLSAAEEEQDILLKELEFVRKEKNQGREEYERLKSECSKFQISIPEKQDDVKVEEVPSFVEESLKAEVERLQQALLGMKTLRLHHMICCILACEHSFVKQRLEIYAQMRLHLAVFYFGTFLSWCPVPLSVLEAAAQRRNILLFDS
uniref:Uncharacterized protein n=1 Tax=Micrurus lemniscatus lemniscatus TaxID=129467 RepID=A0A2D4I0M2_MICLE